MMGEKTTVLESRMDRIVNFFGRCGFIFSIIILITLIGKLIWIKINDTNHNLIQNNLSFFGGIFYIFTYFFVLL